MILDTNVVSEARRPAPDPQVTAWYGAQSPGDLYLTTIVVAELLYGVRSMPSGMRRRAHQEWLEDQITTTFAQRILAFDLAAARAYAELAAEARARGRPPAIADAQIAAVAKARGFAVATRNIRDFEGLGVPLINPWAWQRET